VKNALEGSLAEVNYAKLALQKSQDKNVREFATKMIHDHEMLISDMKPLAKQLGVKVPTGPPLSDHAKYMELKMKSGTDFDRAYVEAMVKDGHEVGFHGYIHEAPNSLSRDEEHYWINRSIDVIKKHTGKRPRGARSPLYNFSINTADLLVEEGFVYDASLMGDDVPYILATKKGSLVELPSHWALDDWPPYVHSLDLNYVMQIMSPDRAMEIFMSEFEAMRECGGGLWIGVWHPFVSGRLARWLRVERMIEQMMKTGEVWFAPLEEIARHVNACRKKGSYKPRVDKLPYYDKPVGIEVPPLLTRAPASE